MAHHMAEKQETYYVGVMSEASEGPCRDRGSCTLHCHLSHKSPGPEGQLRQVGDCLSVKAAFGTFGEVVRGHMTMNLSTRSFASGEYSRCTPPWVMHEKCNLTDTSRVHQRHLPPMTTMTIIGTSRKTMTTTTTSRLYHLPVILLQEAPRLCSTLLPVQVILPQEAQRLSNMPSLLRLPGLPVSPLSIQ